MESRRPLLILVALAAVLLAGRAAPADAQPIFSEDFESGGLLRWAPCQLGIFPLSPGPPSSWGGGYPDHDIFNDIRSNDPINPVTLVGTFTSVPDPADPAVGSIPFLCSVDSATALDCSDLDYELSGALVDGPHTVSISGNACGIAHAPPPFGFFIDAQPPFFSNVNVAVDDANATAYVTMRVADQVTNIESLDCLVDFDDQGQNPDTTSSVHFVPCSSFGSSDPLPMRPDPGVARPRSYSATLHFTELAPGQHRLWYRATDYWGHRSVLSSVFFTVDATAAVGHFGHVIAIGHDFDSANADLQKLVGNSVLLMVPTPFNRPIRVLALDLGSADSEGIPKEIVFSSIFSRALALGLPGFDYAQWGGDDSQDDEGIAAHLYGRDVLLIYDQNDPARSAEIGAKVHWLSTLQDFVNAGGVVVVLDGLYAGGSSYSGTLAIVGNAGPGSPYNLLDTGLVAPADPGSQVDLVCRSDSLLALDVGAMPEPRHFSSPASAIAQHRDPLANEIFCTGLACDPVVQDRKYPQRVDEGPVRVQAFGLDSSSDEVVPRSGSDYAVFTAPSGAIEGFCRLNGAGFASHDLTAGGMVTVASTNGLFDALSGYGGSLDLESVLDAQPGDTIVVGRTTNPPRSVAGAIEVEIPQYANPYTAKYYLTNGCSSVTVDATGANPVLTLPTPTDECLVNGTEMSFLAEARDFNGEVQAYATLTGMPRLDANSCHGVEGFDGWCVDAGDWSITPWAGPQSLYIQYAGGLPAEDLDAVQVLPRHGTSHVGLEEGLGLVPSSQQYFTPRIPNPFADVLRVSALVYSTPPSVPGFSLITDATDRPLPTSGLPSPVVLERSRFLPRIIYAGLLSSTPDRPHVGWQLEFSGSLAGAQGGLGVVTYSASSFCCDPRDVSCGFGPLPWHGSWSFVIPPSAPGFAEVTLPALPGELNCWRPIADDAVFQSLAFVKIDVLGSDPTADDFRRSAADTFDTYFDSLRTKVGEAGTETWMTAFCSQASYCEPNATPDSPVPASRIFLGCYTPPAIAEILCH